MGALIYPVVYAVFIAAAFLGFAAGCKYCVYDIELWFYDCFLNSLIRRKHLVADMGQSIYCQ